MKKQLKPVKSGGQGRLPFPYLAVILFGLGAVYFFAVAADLLYWNHRLDIDPTLRVPGVISHLEKGGGRSVTYKIDYSYTNRAGRLQRGVTDIDQATWNALRTGESIPVDYLVDSPGRSRYGHEEKWLSSLVFGGVLAAMAACTGVSRKIDSVKHIRLGLSTLGNSTPQPDQDFRATLDQHWPFSLILAGLGCGLLYFLRLGTDEPFDTGMIGRVALLPLALFLVSLPPLFHFRFYVRLTDAYFETRGLGRAHKIAWRELTDVWQYQTPQTAFASADQSFSVNFKLFSRDCYVRVRERIEAQFGKSI